MLRANLGLLVSVLAWGSMIPCVNAMVPRWDPFLLTSGRYVIAGPLFLLIVVLVESHRGLGRALANWRGWLLGAVGGGLFGPLLIVGVAPTHPFPAPPLSALAPALIAAGGSARFPHPPHPPPP